MSNGIYDVKVKFDTEATANQIQKLTESDINSQIKQVVYHQFPGTTVTVCCITLTNGYNVIGESGCVDPAGFNEQLGKDIAYRNAREKIWTLEGYMLKQKLFCFGAR